MKKSLILLLKLGVTVGVLAWLLARVKLGTVVGMLVMISPATLIAAGFLVAVQPFAAAVRWHLVMKFLGVPLSLAQTLQISWIGLFAAALLPGGLAGDGLRMLVLARTGVRPSKSVNSVLLDRMAALAGLLLLVAVSLPLLGDQIADPLVRYGAAGLLVAGVAFGLFVRLPSSWQRFRAARAVATLSNDLWTVCQPLWRAASLIALSAFAILCNSLNVLLLLRSLGTPVGLLDCMVLAPIVVLVLTLPISLGGWGLREGTMVGLFGMIGVAPAASVAVSVLIGLLSTAVSIPGAVLWLRWWHEAGALANLKAGAAYTAARNPDG